MCRGGDPRERAERWAVSELADVPAGDRPTSSSGEGLA